MLADELKSAVRAFIAPSQEHGVDADPRMDSSHPLPRLSGAEREPVDRVIGASEAAEADRVARGQSPRGGFTARDPSGARTVFRVPKRAAEEVEKMLLNGFPQDPSQRRAILVLQEHDVEKCAYTPDAAEALLDPETCVLSFPIRVSEGAHPAVGGILGARIGQPGALLVQSPFDQDKYEEASVAPERFALTKHMIFSELCMYLGATEVIVEQVDLRTSTGTTSLDLTADSKKVFRASAEMVHESLERFRSELQLRDVFAGAPPDLEAAQSLLRTTGLERDPNMASLLAMRRSRANRIKERKIRLSLSNEANENLRVAAKVGIPAFVKVKSNYERIRKEVFEYNLTLTVRF